MNYRMCDTYLLEIQSDNIVHIEPTKKEHDKTIENFEKAWNGWTPNFFLIPVKD